MSHDKINILSIWSRWIVEHVGLSKLIHTNVAETDIKLFMNLICPVYFVSWKGWGLAMSLLDLVVLKRTAHVSWVFSLILIKDIQEERRALRARAEPQPKQVQNLPVSISFITPTWDHK